MCLCLGICTIFNWNRWPKNTVGARWTYNWIRLSAITMFLTSALLVLVGFGLVVKSAEEYRSFNDEDKGDKKLMIHAVLIGVLGVILGILSLVPVLFLSPGCSLCVVTVMGPITLLESIGFGILYALYKYEIFMKHKQQTGMAVSALMIQFILILAAAMFSYQVRMAREFYNMTALGCPCNLSALCPCFWCLRGRGRWSLNTVVVNNTVTNNTITNNVVENHNLTNLHPKPVRQIAIDETYDFHPRDALHVPNQSMHPSPQTSHRGAPPSYKDSTRDAVPDVVLAMLPHYVFYRPCLFCLPFLLILLCLIQLATYAAGRLLLPPLLVPFKSHCLAWSPLACLLMSIAMVFFRFAHHCLHCLGTRDVALVCLYCSAAVLQLLCLVISEALEWREFLIDREKLFFRTSELARGIYWFSTVSTTVAFAFAVFGALLTYLVEIKNPLSPVKKGRGDVAMRNVRKVGTTGEPGDNENIVQYRYRPKPPIPRSRDCTHSVDTIPCNSSASTASRVKSLSVHIENDVSLHKVLRTLSDRRAHSYLYTKGRSSTPKSKPDPPLFFGDDFTPTVDRHAADPFYRPLRIPRPKLSTPPVFHVDYDEETPLKPPRLHNNVSFPVL